jgi:hypothetical protein
MEQNIKREQQLRDLRWMLKFQGYKTADDLKYTRTSGKHIARSVEFLDNSKVLIKYMNTDTNFKEKRELELEDAFNWIS